VGGIYSGRNQIGVRQRARIKIGPSFDAAPPDPDVHEFSAKQTIINTLEFVKVGKCFLGINKYEKLSLNKSVRNGTEHSPGILLAAWFIKRASHPCFADESNYVLPIQLAMGLPSSFQSPVDEQILRTLL
jgi:hypothetical protein